MSYPAITTVGDNAKRANRPDCMHNDALSAPGFPSVLYSLALYHSNIEWALEVVAAAVSIAALPSYASRPANL